MKKIAIVSILVSVLGSTVEAQAQGWEVSILGGWTAPTFEQQFVFSTDIDIPDIPGGNIRQSGDFLLKANGSFAFGGGVSYFFNEHVAIEGRIDTINFNIDSTGPRFTADFDVIPGLPPATAVLDVGIGSVNVQRLFPLSVNIKARTGGNARFVASGGLSYLPRVRFNAVQPVSLGIGGLGLPVIEVARVVLEAGALANASENRWGINFGAGVEVDVSPKVAIVGDVRVHSFQSQTFVWQPSDAPSSATAGVSIRF